MKWVILKMWWKLKPSQPVRWAWMLRWALVDCQKIQLLKFTGQKFGQTTLALHTVAEAQKTGGICGFIDAEHALDPAYANKLGVNIEELLISQPDN